MSMHPDLPEQPTPGMSGAGRPLPAIARYWWLMALRGLVALALTVAGRNTGRLITFLALFWLTGGLITPRSGWDAAGPWAGSCSAPWNSGLAPCCWPRGCSCAAWRGPGRDLRASLH
jgi:hypothetical protein